MSWSQQQKVPSKGMRRHIRKVKSARYAQSHSQSVHAKMMREYNQIPTAKKVKNWWGADVYKCPRCNRGLSFSEVKITTTPLGKKLSFQICFCGSKYRL